MKVVVVFMVLSLKHELLFLKVWNKIFTGLGIHLIDSYQMYGDFGVVTLLRDLECNDFFFFFTSYLQRVFISIDFAINQKPSPGKILAVENGNETERIILSAYT